MTTEQKIEAIKGAIERANNLQSKMDATAWAVPALSSLRIRHLMNNLGAISTRYMECGVHKGGLFCSTLRNNFFNGLAAIDNWASDDTSDDKAFPQFRDNVEKCMPLGQCLMIDTRKSDTFSVDPTTLLMQPYDLYLYDADHSYESQKRAMTYFLPAMADEFILCVDDYDWEDVWKGTQDGLKDAGVEILYEHAFIGNDHDNMGWWNGFYVALIRKNKQNENNT